MREKQIQNKIILTLCMLSFVGGLILYTTRIYRTKVKDENTTKNIEINTTPGDSSFKDINFYSCVVYYANQLNQFNNYEYSETEYTVNDIIPDSLLSKINSLSCFGRNVISINGIEKLPNLVTLSLGHNNLTTIKIMNTNLKLANISLSTNKISNFVFEPAENLKSLTLAENSIYESINLKPYINLEKLTLLVNNLTSLDVSSMKNLVSLDVGYNNLSELNLENNTKLQKLFINDNKISNLNLTQNKSIKQLALHNNKFSVVDKYLKVGETAKIDSPINLSSGYILTPIDTSIVSADKDSIKALKVGSTEVNLKVGKYFNQNFTVTVEEKKDSETKENNQTTNNTTEPTNDPNSNDNNVSEQNNSDKKNNYNSIKNSLNNDNNLKSLKVNEGTIEFDKDILEYNLTVNNEVEKLTVDAVPNSSKSTVKKEIPNKLNIGNNVATISVISETGSIKNYQLNVKRLGKEEVPSSDSNLKSLIVDDYILNFKSKIKEYTILINDIDKLDISYVPSNLNSSVTIKNNKGLKNGSKVKIIVVAEDGSKTTYSIKIKKKFKYTNYVLALIIIIIGILFIYFYLIRMNKKNEEVEIIK